MLMIFFLSSALYAEDGHSITINSNQPQFTVTLPANPTTGFQWTVLSYDNRLFSFTKSKYIAPQASRIGAGGTMVFTFTKVKADHYPESSEIQFKYARAWEPDNAVVTKVIIKFNPS